MYLYQNTFKIDNVINMANSEAKVEIDMDKSLMLEDLEAYRERLKRKHLNKYDRENILGISKYIEKLAGAVNEDSILEIKWGLSDKLNIPITKPLILYKEKLYSFDAMSYMMIKPGMTYVDVNLSSLADLISYDMIFRELGESNAKMEELLENCGIICSNDSDIITNYFSSKGYRPYEDSKVLKVSDSPYLVRDKKAIKDYFGTRSVKADSYRDIVEYSCIMAASIVADNVLKNAINKHTSVQMVSILPTCVRFIMKGVFTEDYILEDIVGKIDVRVFGRRFRINNCVITYGAGQ